jgi:hypothetical protein
MQGMAFAVCDKMPADAVRKYNFSNNIDREFSNLNVCRRLPSGVQVIAGRQSVEKTAACLSTGSHVDEAMLTRAAILSAGIY